MADKVYTEGFPEGWAMVHREDCTLLGYRNGLNPFGAFTAICLAPKLKQGEAWLETAKTIAVAMAGTKKQEADRIIDEFCDSCGIGPPYDDDKPMINVRATATWKCDRCDHTNERPRNQHEHSISDAAAIAVDAAIKNAGNTRPKLSRQIEKLLIDAATIAVATERTQKPQNS
jgi:hypothetical protein